MISRRGLEFLLDEMEDTSDTYIDNELVNKLSKRNAYTKPVIAHCIGLSAEERVRLRHFNYKI